MLDDSSEDRIDLGVEYGSDDCDKDIGISLPANFQYD